MLCVRRDLASVEQVSLRASPSFSGGNLFLFFAGTLPSITCAFGAFCPILCAILCAGVYGTLFGSSLRQLWGACQAWRLSSVNLLRQRFGEIRRVRCTLGTRSGLHAQHRGA